jgi:hypothetical protein
MRTSFLSPVIATVAGMIAYAVVGGVLLAHLLSTTLTGSGDDLRLSTAQVGDTISGGSLQLEIDHR